MKIQYSRFYKHLTICTGLWAVFLLGYILYIYGINEEHYSNYGMTISSSKINEIPFFAFCGIFYFLIRTLTHHLHNILLIPNNTNKFKEIIKFGLICIDLMIISNIQHILNSYSLFLYILINIITVYGYLYHFKLVSIRNSDQYFLTLLKHSNNVKWLCIIGMVFLCIIIYTLFIIFIGDS